ncbi:DUF6339 family protein [Kineococcus sp. SYSU DK002]|uniref:DUF6339 family protein n=1 Tax=Kineococcus sp. SYSU DK002 TaxID=3383123 RepID=UPI003D7D4296
MTTQPHRLAYEALRKATPSFLLGLESVDFTPYLVPTSPDLCVDLDAVRILLDKAMVKYDANPSAADSWLAPCLHAALRLDRHQAADQGLWRWMGLVWAPDFVRWRFSKPVVAGEDPKPVRLERFAGRDDKHALARLWWAAEIFRNGPDYDPVGRAMAVQDIPNNFIRIAPSHHRPTAQAFIKVIHAIRDRPGDAANALSKATNAAASTLVLDLMAPDETQDVEALRGWQHAIRDFDPLTVVDNLPDGPDDGDIPQESIDAMERLLTELLAETPRRDRSRPAGGETT